jgi:hypothetical protein
MAKSLRWQIPFQSSVTKTDYVISIYDENDGSWSGVTQLTPATNPFETEESNDKDYFAPIRSTKASINVIDPSGTLMQELLPADCLSRPVMVTQGEDVVYCGALTPDVYTSRYTNIAQSVSLKANGILEAMQSVDIELNDVIGVVTVQQALSIALKNFAQQSGLSLTLNPPVTRVLVSANAASVLSKMIDLSAVFKIEEIAAEDTVYEEIKTISCHDLIKNICTFMGWCAREKGKSLLFQRIGETYGMYEYTYANFVNGTGSPVLKTLASVDMSTFTWMDDNHTIDCAQGAKSVAVVAKLEPYKLTLTLPDTPQILSTDPRHVDLLFQSGSGQKHVSTYLKTGIERMGIAFNYYQLSCGIDGGVYTSVSADVISVENIVRDVVNALIVIQGLEMEDGAYKALALNYIEQQGLEFYSFVSGAFLAKIAIETRSAAVPDTKDGLLCALLPYSGNVFDWVANINPIFTLSSVIKRYLPRGYFILTADYAMFAAVHNVGQSAQIWCRENGDNVPNTRFYFILQHANKYWNGSAWTTTKSMFYIEQASYTEFKFMDNWNQTMDIPQTSGYIIPVDGDLMGEVKLGLMTPAHDGLTNNCFEVFFTSLKMDYKPAQSIFTTDRDANNYYRVLGVDFREKKSIDTVFATLNGNNPSPSLMLDSIYKPTRTITYMDSSSSRSQRPECDLQDRMDAYYRQKRRTLTVGAQPINTDYIPNTLVQGLDGRTYLPLSIKRKWIEDTDTITLFETPSNE